MYIERASVFPFYCPYEFVEVVLAPQERGSRMVGRPISWLLALSGWMVDNSLEMFDNLPWFQDFIDKNTPVLFFLFRWGLFVEEVRQPALVGSLFCFRGRRWFSDPSVYGMVGRKISSTRTRPFSSFLLDGCLFEEVR